MHATHPGSEDRHGTLQVAPETDEIVALCLEGEFDIANAPALVEQIDQAIGSNKHLVIDLSAATFVDSTVINALFHAGRAAKAKERTVVLQLGTAAIVERMIEITEIEQALPRASTRADAVQTIQRAAHRPPRSPRWGIPARRSGPAALVGKADRLDR